MKATLEFELPEEREEHQLAVNAGAMSAAIDEIRNKVFRPARKHGYPDAKIQELLNKIPDGDGYTLISELEDIFSAILEEYDVR